MPLPPRSRRPTSSSPPNIKVGLRAFPAGAFGLLERPMRFLSAPLLFLARRVLQALLVMLAIATVAFAVQQSLGDPLRELVGERVPEAERARLKEQLGLDAP